MTRDEEVKYAIAEFYQTMADTLNALMRALDARARAEEREACAKVCKEIKKDFPLDYLLDGREAGATMCADAIRARGEEKP